VWAGATEADFQEFQREIEELGAGLVGDGNRHFVKVD
jgi:hypothetical protein